MHALQPSRPPLQPAPPPRRRVGRASQRRRQNSYPALAAEASVRLTVNCVLAIAAVSALVKLLPYNVAQLGKLQEIHTEVASLEQQVGELQADFNHHFDPKQARSVMQEQSSRIDPQQRQVVWLSPGTAQPAAGALPDQPTPHGAPQSSPQRVPGQL